MNRTETRWLSQDAIDAALPAVEAALDLDTPHELRQWADLFPSSRAARWGYIIADAWDVDPREVRVHLHEVIDFQDPLGVSGYTDNDRHDVARDLLITCSELLDLDYFSLQRQVSA